MCETLKQLEERVSELEKTVALLTGQSQSINLSPEQRVVANSLLKWVKRFDKIFPLPRTRDYMERFHHSVIRRAMKDGMCTNLERFESCCLYHQRVYDKKFKKVHKKS